MHVSQDPSGDVVVRTWFGEARYGRAREVIWWLHGEVVPRARTSRGCLSAEGFAEAGDGHEVMVVTRWSSIEDADEWSVGEHPSLWSWDESDWVTVDDAQRAIDLDR